MANKDFRKRVVGAPSLTFPLFSLDLIDIVTTGCCSAKLLHKYRFYCAVCLHRQINPGATRIWMQTELAVCVTGPWLGSLAI